MAYIGNKVNGGLADGNAVVSGTLDVSNAVTADGGIGVDNITIDGTEIDLSSGNLTIDVAGDIILDADGGDIFFNDAGVTFAKFSNVSTDFVIKSIAQDKDLIFKGNDNGSEITALTLDMSEAGAATFNSGVTFGGSITGTTATLTTADNTDTLTLVSTDADANQGPILNLFRNSSTPADSDVLAQVLFSGENDNDEEIEYARFQGFTVDVSDGTEDGGLNLQAMLAGTLRSRLKVNGTELTVNDDSQNLDFRIESDDNANMFFVDGANDRVGIGTNSPTSMLQINQSDSTASQTHFTNSTTGTAISDGLLVGINSNEEAVIWNRENTGTVFAANNTERMRIEADGDFVVQEVASTDVITGTGMYIATNGQFYASTSSTSGHFFNISNDSQAVLNFRHAGSTEGDVSISGSTVTFNGFSGTHESSGIASNVAIGTVCSTIDELDVYPDTQPTAKGGTENHPKKGQTRADHAKIKVSDTEGDKRVYGVLQRYDNNGKPLVASVGIGSIRVTGACEGGDLLESNGDGTAKVQSDDIIRSKTIGKVTIGNSSEEVKLVSCVLYCG